ncbi:MAG: DNA translocase FtsK [Clostridiales bacterium]|nr:DNA translocase FtsK [Clostridiales bacterium]
MVKFFGKPGLIIIAVAVLLISIFLVANTPISRFFEKMSKKRENRRIMNELEEAEKDKVQMAVAMTARPVQFSEPVYPDPRPYDMEDTFVLKPEKEEKSFWRSIFNGISKVDEPTDLKDRDVLNKSDNYTTPAKYEPTKMQETTSSLHRPSEKNLDQKTQEDSVLEIMKKDTIFGRLAKKFNGEEDSEDYGFPGLKRKAEEEMSSGLGGESSKKKTGYGLGDIDNVGVSGAYGLGGYSTDVMKPKAKFTDNKTKLGLDMADTDISGQDAVASTDITNFTSNLPGANQKVRSFSKDVEIDNKEDQALTESFNASTDDSGYTLPSESLLKRGTSSKQMMSDAQLEEKADLLERTLNDFGVDATVHKVIQGASVTRYEVQPATGVKVSSITRLADDIALNLRAKSIRIEAPIPGKAAVGIEVENEKSAPVYIRDLIDSDEFRNSKSKISFVVGKDISGNNIIADLHDMPHLLIAGATGSGKSVCINTIIASFLYKAKPSELKLIMIDPKVVELANYNGIPHMLTPVVTDARKASRALAIAVEEMNKRYEAFAKEGVKDLESYNDLMKANHEPQNCKPQVVIIIDELADLMMAAPSEVENSICRLAQKARAAGMHMIVATQRPSVDVVTGLIKANIPSRISFSVASQFDSRTILDMSGAEKLLGKGDMLFSPVGSNKPFRIQGPFISDAETARIVRFVKKEGGGPSYDEELKKAIESDEKRGRSEPQDELTDDAIAFILKSKQASVSMLQRRFRIGYNRAARIVDEIEERGIIGPSDGSRPRQVLMSEDEYYGTSEEGSDQKDANLNEMNPRNIDKENITSTDSNAAIFLPEEENENNIDEQYSGRFDEDSRKRGVDSFNSLPKSVQRMIMDADTEHADDKE